MYYYYFYYYVFIYLFCQNWRAMSDAYKRIKMTRYLTSTVAQTVPAWTDIVPRRCASPQGMFANINWLYLACLIC